MRNRHILTAALMASTFVLALPASAQLLGGASGGAPGVTPGGINNNGAIGDGMTPIPPNANANARAGGTAATPPVTAAPNNVARNAEANANRAVGNTDSRSGAAMDNAINGANGMAGANANAGTPGPGASANASSTDTLNSANSTARSGRGAVQQETTRQLNQQPQANVGANGAVGAQAQ